MNKFENLSLENLSLEEYFKRTAEIIDWYVGEDFEEEEEEVSKEATLNEDDSTNT